MINLKDDEILVYDENNKESKMKILFTYENEERAKKYIFFFKEKSPDEVIAMIYNDRNELFPIEDDEEYAEVQEVFDAFEQEDELKDEKKTIHK